MGSPRIPRYNDAAIRTLVAAKNGPFYMYIPARIQISQYQISDILNRGHLVAGDGGSLGNRSLLLRAECGNSEGKLIDPLGARDSATTGNCVVPVREFYNPLGTEYNHP